MNYEKVKYPHIAATQKHENNQHLDRCCANSLVPYMDK